MIAPRSVIVRIRCAADCRATVEAGVEFARLFRAPIHGLFLEDELLHDLCDLPSAFLPATIHRAARYTHRGAMAAALMQETRRVRGDLERLAARARVEVRVTVHSGVPGETAAEAARSEDLIVTSVDLSQRLLGPSVAAAVRLCPPAGGVLLIPERRPSPSGIVVALARGPDDRTVAVAARIAADLGVAVAVALPDRSDAVRNAIRERVAAIAGAGHSVRFFDLPDARLLSAATVGIEAVRLVLSATRDVKRIDLDSPEAVIRRYRAPLLVLN